MATEVSLQGKVALVTGGGAGIGKAICLRLADAGAAIAVLDIRADLAGETVAAVEAAGGRAVPVECDVTSCEQARRALSALASTIGPPDILVNNAGIDIVRPFVDTDESLWRKLEPKRRLRRKMLRGLSQRQLRELDLREHAAARPPVDCIGWPSTPVTPT